MIQERRNTTGLAVVTTVGRAAQIERLVRATEMSARILMVQDGPAWPMLRPPTLLDTIGLLPEVLVALLATSPPSPLVALADPADWRALRLLALCPAVRVIMADDMATLRRWVGHLASLLPRYRTRAEPVWLVPAPAPLPLHPLVLPVLAALLSSPSYTMAAVRCQVSESTIYRVLRTTRATLKLPPGAVARFRPAELAARILDRLGADAPVITDLPTHSRWVPY
jgi:hypothetical protein